MMLEDGPILLPLSGGISQAGIFRMERGKDFR